jgi:hypothetical protein
MFVITNERVYACVSVASVCTKIIYFLRGVVDVCVCKKCMRECQLCLAMRMVGGHFFKE